MSKDAPKNIEMPMSKDVPISNVVKSDGSVAQMPMSKDVPMSNVVKSDGSVAQMPMSKDVGQAPQGAASQTAQATSPDITLTSNVSVYMCNRNTQVMDLASGGCISCRDPTVKPIVNSTPSTTTPITLMMQDPLGRISRIPGYEFASLPKDLNLLAPNMSYTCNNNPYKTYDGNNKLISQTCDSGETFNTTTGMCVITFLPKTNNNGKVA
jgi:hypothetical protein